MIRGFLLLSLLFTIAIVAVFGFRGQKSTGSPIEVFPDMVRQMKVRAQAPSAFFADGRGPRLPVAGTVPAFFPIMFELTVLFSAFAAFFAWQIMNGLPRWHHPIFNWERFKRATNDGFFLAIEARDPRFTEMEARELLERTGGQHITIVHED